jgi:tRNA (guanine37-N1)-methyltransferase
MLFRVLTIFPELINDYMKVGVLGRALKKKIIKVEAVDIRRFADDKHNKVDDKPYGGGAGMVMRAEPIYKALKSFRKSKNQKIILLSAKGKKWNQALARKYSNSLSSIVFVCGRYEGVDERVMKFIDEEISIGDYVLTGGELGALTLMDSIARLVPGVLGNSESLVSESHSEAGLLEYPQYTKPESLKLGGKTYRVPKVLLSGHHAEIENWRKSKTKFKKAGR